MPCIYRAIIILYICRVTAALKNIKRSDVRFLVALLVAHAAFFALALTARKIYNGDSAEYIYMAVNIKDHWWFYAGNPALPIVPENLTLRTPLYSMFIALVYLFSINNWIVLVLQNLISIFNIWYLRQTIRLIGYSRKYDWVLISFVLLYPAQFIHTNTIAPDILLQTTVLVYFRHFILMVSAHRWRHAYIMSAALIIGMLIKPVLYPFTFVHCLMLLYISLRLKNGLFRPFIAGILPLSVLLMYGMWNYSRTGKMHFSSTQSFNAIFYYYCYVTDHEGAEAGAAFLQRERAEMDMLPTFSQRYDYANARGKELLNKNFGSYMLYHLRNSARMLIDPGKAEMDMFTGRLTLSSLYKPNDVGFFYVIKKQGISGVRDYIKRNPSLPIALAILIFNLLRLAGLVLFLFTAYVSKVIKLFVFGLVLYFTVTTGPIANTRYMLPISLIMIGASVTGYQHLLLRYRNKAIIAE